MILTGIQNFQSKLLDSLLAMRIDEFYYDNDSYMKVVEEKTSLTPLGRSDLKLIGTETMKRKHISLWNFHTLSI